MKILYLRLENFIGIYNGMNKSVYEVHLNSKNKIVLLLGDNGSGKTTVLSCLHPFSGTMDDRNEIIRAGFDGYKEIHFLKDGSLYKIRHHYLNKNKTKSIKSYISKDDVELNESGRVKMFESIVKDELDVTPSFFVISRIGTNVKNFIGLKPSERKNYMTEFLPDISKYLLAYKNVNEKYLDNNKTIKYIYNEINKLEDEENLRFLSDRYKRMEDDTSKEISKIEEICAKNNGKIEILSGKVDTDKYNTVESKLATVRKSIDSIDVYFSSLSGVDLVDKSKITKILTKMDKNISIVQKRLTKNVTEFNSYKTRIEELKQDIEKKENELKNLNTERDLDELNNLKSDLTNRIAGNNDLIDKYEERFKLNVSDDVINGMIATFNSLLEYDVFTTHPKIITFIENTINKESGKINDYSEAYDGFVNEYTAKVSDILNQIADFKEKIAFYKSKLSLKDILDKRPDKCKIDSCNFIKEAVKYKDAEDKIASFNDEIDKLSEEMTGINKKLNTYVLKRDFYKGFFKAYNYLTESIYYKYFVILFSNTFSSKEEFFNFLTVNKNPFREDFQKALDYYFIYSTLKDDKSTLKDIKKELSYYKDKVNIIDSIKDEIKLSNEKIETLHEKMTELKDAIEEDTKKESKYIDKKADYISYEELFDKYQKFLLAEEKYANYIDKYKESFSIINELNKINESYQKELDKLKGTLESVKKDKEDVIYKIKSLEKFKSTLEDLNNKAKNIELVRNALSPTKGIPLLFVDIYLKKTQKIANDLLKYAFNDRFYIDRFIINESEFLINITKENGIPIKDVTLTSQGEMALIGLTISLAMIQQARREYNIPLIDEMDKDLDSEKRKFFVDIINKQLDTLKVEQSFIISHNKEFDSANVDLILFEGNDVSEASAGFLEGKNILS